MNAIFRDYITRKVLLKRSKEFCAQKFENPNRNRTLNNANYVSVERKFNKLVKKASLQHNLLNIIASNIEVPSRLLARLFTVSVQRNRFINVCATCGK